MVSALINLPAAVLLIGAYHAWNSSTGPSAIAMLDVAEIYRLKESEFAALLLKPGATEADRSRAIELARSFGTELSALTERLPAECKCLVITKAAVVGGSVTDLTPEVKRRFGL